MLKVKDIMNMEFAQNLQLICGSKGVDKPVTSVGLHLHEEIEEFKDVFGKGDFVLTTLHACKTDSRKILDYLQAFYSAGVSALAIQTVYIDSLPENAVNYCNQKGFSVFFYSKKFYTEDLVMAIKMILERNDVYNQYEQALNHILEQTATESELKMMARLTGGDKKMPIDIYYFRFRKKIEDADVGKLVYDWDYRIGTLLPQLGIRFVKYKEGFFIFHKRAGNQAETLAEILSCYKMNPADFFIGKSCYAEEETMKDGLEESLMASLVCQCEQKECMDFQQIGIYRWLLPLNKTGHLYGEYQKFIRKIMEYDKNKHTELLTTAICYVEHKGELATTAKELYQHVNTVRYRLNRIKEITEMADGTGDDFYVLLYIFIKLYRLMEKTEAFV